MTENQPERDTGASAGESPPSRPAPRNPFQQPEPSGEEKPPALIDSQKSAAVLGVAVGLLALLLLVAICVAASFAFG